MSAPEPSEVQQSAESVRCWFCNSDTPPGVCTHCGTSTEKPAPLADYVAPPGAVVVVNEARIYVTERASDWWMWFRHASPSSRFEERSCSLAGGIVAVTCEDREHADWLAAHMVTRGVPESAVTVESPCRGREPSRAVRTARTSPSPGRTP